MKVFETLKPLIVAVFFLIPSVLFAAPAQVPVLMSYWMDESVHTNDVLETGSPKYAIPSPAYVVPNSVDDKANAIVNSDFSSKLVGLNMINYAYLQAIAFTYTYTDKAGVKHTLQNMPFLNKVGTLYFADPITDIRVKKPINDTFCKDHANLSCWYATNMQNIAPDDKGLGNFDAFTQLQHAKVSNPLGKLQKLIAVGGPGNAQTFDDTFAAENGIANFVASAKAILDHYYAGGNGIVGINLDYRNDFNNVNPTIAKLHVAKYVQLVKQLRAALGDKFIIVSTMLADPAYLNRFSASQWKEINDNVNLINVLAYDFHGPFDFKNGSGKTGLITSIVPQSGTPFSPHYSISNTISTLESNGVESNKILIELPTRGVAYQNVSNNNDGLFQNFSGIAPKGEYDLSTCDQALPISGSNACRSKYSYRYLVDYVVNDVNPQLRFKVRTWETSGYYNAATGHFTGQWPLETIAGANRALPETLKNPFISYVSISPVHSFASYSLSKKLAGLGFECMKDDTPLGNPKGNSLISAALSKFLPSLPSVSTLQIVSEVPKNITVAIVPSDGVDAGHQYLFNMPKAGSKNSVATFTNASSASIGKIFGRSHMSIVLTDSDGQQYTCNDKQFSFLNRTKITLNTATTCSVSDLD